MFIIKMLLNLNVNGCCSYRVFDIKKIEKNTFINNTVQR